MHVALTYEYGGPSLFQYFLDARIGPRCQSYAQYIFDLPLHCCLRVLAFELTNIIHAACLECIGCGLCAEGVDNM